MHSSVKHVLAVALSGMALLSLPGCGGGGSGSGSEGTAPVAATNQTIVSGTVQAPGGAVAFFKQPRLEDLFVSEAYAALTGLANVPDNTIVQLARLNANASSFSVLSTATTAGGRYSFNLTTLGLQPANDLIVRVAGPSGREMRAFVVGTIADISPVSEAGCQLAIQSLSGRPLDNLTLQEVSDITGAVSLIALLQNIGTAITVDQGVDLVRAAAGGNSQVASFITAAAEAGQTTKGTGDIGNFFPFNQGSIWRYRGTRVNSVGSPTSYDTVLLVSGQEAAPVDGAPSTAFSETNAQGENRSEKSYEVKGTSGITSHGTDDSSDRLTSQLVPFQSAHFPLTIGATTVLIERNGLDWGEDEDGDGNNERVNVKITQTIRGIESVTISTGTFSNSIRIESKAVFIVTFSGGGNGTVTQTNTAWYASGIGRIREAVQFQVNNESALTSITEDLVGYVVNGQGSGLRVEITPSTISLPEGQTVQLHATAFDQNNSPLLGIPFAWSSSDPSIASVSQTGLVTANRIGTTTLSVSGGSNSVPTIVSTVRILPITTNDLLYDRVSSKLYASTPGPQGGIIAIDPVTGAVGPTVLTGSDPNKLAISDNGQYLYVSLDEGNAIRRLNLPSLTTDSTFSIGAPPPSTPHQYVCGKDIDVVPGSPRDVVVARATHLGSGSCNFNEPQSTAFYRNGVELPNTSSGATVHLLEFSDTASLAFGLGIFSPGTLSKISVTPSGLSLSDTARLSNWPGRDFKYVNGLIYLASGDVVDPSSYSVVGSYTTGQSGGAFSMRPDTTLQRLFITTFGDFDTVAVIRSFDLTSLALLGSLEIKNLGSPTIPQLTRTTGLSRWGSNGLAFRTTSNEVVLIQSPLVEP
ncbi:MAG: Ig-like domain-containing protein [Nitrospira sp.]|nr:Ig-like domain-containing protein [Nitrospira sp.]